MSGRARAREKRKLRYRGAEEGATATVLIAGVYIEPALELPEEYFSVDLVSQQFWKLDTGDWIKNTH